MAVSRADLNRLRDPFPPSDIEWRVQQSGDKNGKPWARVLAYVTARAIMDRLDAIVGPENWKNDYDAGPGGGVVCSLSVRVATDGGSEWVTKRDGAENTDVEAVKGGISSALKRAAVCWGIGRYLYHLGDGWAKVHDGGANHAKGKDGTSYRWDPPDLPTWALPGGSGKPTADAPRAAIQRTEYRAADGAAGLTVLQAVELDPDAARRMAERDAAARVGIETTGTPTGSTKHDITPDGVGFTHEESFPTKCPACAGLLWDDRAKRTNPRAPLAKCRDKTNCGMTLWPDGRWTSDRRTPARA